MHKRGISPLIATVLIIGFTVAIAAAVITWGTGFFKGMSEKTETEEEKTRTCAAATVEITGIEQTGPGELSFMLENTGQPDIESVTIRITGDKGTASIPHLGIKSAEKKSYQGLKFDVSKTGYDVTKIEILPTVEVNKQPTFCAPGTAGEAGIPEDTWGATCGNNQLEELLEDCDKAGGATQYSLGKQSCTDLGFEGGTPGCNLQYCAFDTSQCTGEPLCGNKKLDLGEECDLDKFNRPLTGGKTCESEGFGGGEPYCTDQCKLDTSRCTGRCGNGQIDWFIHKEQCDTVGGQTAFHTDTDCSSRGYDTGELLCTGCTIDESGCYNIEAEKIATGYTHTCALTNQKNVYCWGLGVYGQLGLGSSKTMAYSPRLVDLANVKDVEAGFYHTCALTEDNEMYCWGYNYWGQIGIGKSGQEDESARNIYTPTRVTGLDNPTQISTSAISSCAVENSQMYCWGYDWGRILDGVSYTISSPKPVPGMTAVTDISAGYTTCAVKDSQLYCWGYGFNGQLGLGPRVQGLPTPTNGAVPEMTNPAKMTSTYVRTCAIKDSQLYCWGYNSNDYRTLGIGETPAQTIYDPTPIPGMTAVTEIGTGYFHTCAIKDSQLYCWGWNPHGQVGTGGTNTPIANPTATQMTNPTKVSKGCGHHTCAANSTGLYCWGYNNNGQLGIGSRTPTPPYGIPTPTKVEFT